MDGRIRTRVPEFTKILQKIKEDVGAPPGRPAGAYGHPGQKLPGGKIHPGSYFPHAPARRRSSRVMSWSSRLTCPRIEAFSSARRVR